MNVKNASFVSFFSLFVLILAITSPETSYAQFGKGKSSVTGNKFRLRNKSRGKMPKNYLNSLQFIGGIGAASYIGDLCDGGGCIELVRPSLTAGLQYRYSHHLAFRGKLSWVRISGDDEKGLNPERNLQFRSDIVELSATGTYDIFPYNKMYVRRRTVNPYGMVGFGVLYYNPQGEIDGEWHSLRPLQTEKEDYGSVSFTLIYGGGIRFKVNPLLNFGVEVGYRQTLTDRLDDVSGEYNQENYSLSPDSPARILTDRRNELDPNRNFGGKNRGGELANDHYIVYGIYLEYTIKVLHQRYNINSNPSRLRVIRSVKRR